MKHVLYACFVLVASLMMIACKAESSTSNKSEPSVEECDGDKCKPKDKDGKCCCGDECNCCGCCKGK